MAIPVKIQATLIKIQKHGADTYTLYFQPHKKLPRFKMGQFLHLALDDYDPQGGFWPTSRIFSIASGPASAELVIVYSVKGLFTKRMQAELCEGKVLWLKLPYGDFIIDAHIGQDESVVLIAGGTGFSPFVSWLADKAAQASPRKTLLFYGVRQPGMLLFQDIISLCKQTMPGFKLHLFVEENLQNAPVEITPHCLAGRLSFDFIYETTRQLEQPVYFLSGPPVMLKAFKEQLQAAGVHENKIKIDEWE